MGDLNICTFISAQANQPPKLELKKKCFYYIYIYIYYYYYPLGLRPDLLQVGRTQAMHFWPKSGWPGCCSA